MHVFLLCTPEKFLRFGVRSLKIVGPACLKLRIPLFLQSDLNLLQSVF